MQYLFTIAKCCGISPSTRSYVKLTPNRHSNTLFILERYLHSVFESQMYNSADFNTSQIARFCGATMPIDVIRSSGNQMFIRMRTDGSVARKGFKAKYSTGNALQLGLYYSYTVFSMERCVLIWGIRTKCSLIQWLHSPFNLCKA